MDHEEAVRQNATERYLLDELDPEQRDQFEGHFFDCQDCATDVRSANLFLEQSKVVLGEPAMVESRRALVSAGKQERFGWLRSAFLAPIFALLLVVVGYQNLVQLPRLQSAHLLPATSINLLTWGSNSSSLVIHTRQGFLVNVIIPPGPRYSSYQADLRNSQGKLDSSLPIPAAAANETWPIEIPGADRESGVYSLAVHAVTAEGKQVEVGRGSFELQIQK
jgi:hypothetical protein